MEICDLQWSGSVPLPFPPPAATPLHELHSGDGQDLSVFASIPTVLRFNGTYCDDEGALLYQVSPRPKRPCNKDLSTANDGVAGERRQLVVVALVS